MRNEGGVDLAGLYRTKEGTTRESRGASWCLVVPRGVSQRIHEVRLRESQKRTLFPRDSGGGSGRFASVTDVKVLADCAYPMSLRTNLVRDGCARTNGTVERDSRKRKSRSRRRRNRRWRWRRNRERPFLEPPTKNKIFFPTRIFSTSLSFSLSLSLSCPLRQQDPLPRYPPTKMQRSSLLSHVLVRGRNQNLSASRRIDDPRSPRRNKTKSKNVTFFSFSSRRQRTEMDFFLTHVCTDTMEKACFCLSFHSRVAKPVQKHEDPTKKLPNLC